MTVVQIETVTRFSREASLTDLSLDGMVVWGHLKGGRNRPHLVNRPSRVFFRKDGKVTVRGSGSITLSDFRVVSAWDKSGQPVSIDFGTEVPTSLYINTTYSVPRDVYAQSALDEWAIAQPKVVKFLRADQKIPAIKAIREATNCSLLQAKRAVETPKARRLYPVGSHYR